MRRVLVAAASVALALCLAPASVLLDARAHPSSAGEAKAPRGSRDDGGVSRRADRATCAKRRKRSSGRRRRPAITPAYRRMRARWHARAPRGILRTWLAADVKPLVIRAVNLGKTFELFPDPGTGRFDAAQLAIAEEAFRYHEDNRTTEVHPRVLELVYRAALRFEAPYVTLVSGYRTTRSTSRHNQGRAMDIVLPGVRDSSLAAFLRRQGFVGVGIYPLSGFVHVDVRAKSFFWRDSSAPGRRSRVRSFAVSQARRYDREAGRRGEVPVPDAADAAAGEGEEDALEESPAEVAAPRSRAPRT